MAHAAHRRAQQEPGGAVLGHQDAPGQTNGAGSKKDGVVKTVADHAVCPAGAVAQGRMGDMGHEDDHRRHGEGNEEPSSAEKSICHGLTRPSAQLPRQEMASSLRDRPCHPRSRTGYVGGVERALRRHGAALQRARGALIPGPPSRNLVVVGRRVPRCGRWADGHAATRHVHLHRQRERCRPESLRPTGSCCVESWPEMSAGVLPDLGIVVWVAAASAAGLARAWRHTHLLGAPSSVPTAVGTAAVLSHPGCHPRSA